VKLPVQFRPPRYVGLASECIAIFFGSLRRTLGHPRLLRVLAHWLPTCSDFKPFGDLRFGDACHYGAAISLKLDKTFCFQPLQGFSNGDFTDIKKLRYVILTDRLVLIQLIGENRFTNMFRDYIRGRWCTSK
jgi:hypothetical protein